MKKPKINIKAVLLVIILLTAFSVPVTAKGKEVINVGPAYKILESILPIECYINGVYSQGSGFVIEGKVFVTNYHVAGGGRDIKINGESIDSDKVIFSNEQLDLMAFQLESGTPLSYNTKLPTVGEEVYAIGYPRNRLKVSTGSIITTFKKYGLQMIFSNVSTDHGSSGGVLLNRQGEVIGITSRISANKKITESIPISYVISEIEKRGA
ncbi:S1 family peptidase [Paenibacillus sinopodophylli]|uniref:S1 family peptidase n=1 Tax=Paenibacillus sinopodophylli TaxID=1837342 RepID=UPI0014862791|nr:serine protease [Paenibacillus sinopodophylli]